MMAIMSSDVGEKLWRASLLSFQQLFDTTPHNLADITHDQRHPDGVVLWYRRGDIASRVVLLEKYKKKGGSAPEIRN